MLEFLMAVCAFNTTALLYFLYIHHKALMVKHPVLSDLLEDQNQLLREIRNEIMDTQEIVDRETFREIVTSRMDNCGSID